MRQSRHLRADSRPALRRILVAVLAVAALAGASVGANGNDNEKGHPTIVFTVTLRRVAH